MFSGKLGMSMVRSDISRYRSVFSLHCTAWLVFSPYTVNPRLYIYHWFVYRMYTPIYMLWECKGTNFKTCSNARRFGLEVYPDTTPYHSVVHLALRRVRPLNYLQSDILYQQYIPKIGKRSLHLLLLIRITEHTPSTFNRNIMNIIVAL